MRNTVIVSIVAFSFAGAAFAQQPAERKIPADVNAVSLSRLPPLTRNDLDAEGKAIYDNIVKDGPAPKTGPVAISLYSPKIAQTWSDINAFLRYNGDLSPRHTEVAICVATWEIQQQYEYSAHEPAALSTALDARRAGRSQTLAENGVCQSRPSGAPARRGVPQQPRPSLAAGARWSLSVL